MFNEDSGHWSCLLVPSNSAENKTVTVSLLRDTLNTQIHLDRRELNLTQEYFMIGYINFTH